MMATSAFVNTQLASCLANGLGSLCGTTASASAGSGFGPVTIGSAGSSLYSSSSSSGSSSAGSTGSREHSISSVDSILSDMVAALSADLEGAGGAGGGASGLTPSDQQCHNCGDNGLMAARCTTCNEVLCDMCASAHQRLPLTKDHIMLRLEDALPFSMAVPPPQLLAAGAPGAPVVPAMAAPAPTPLAAQAALMAGPTPMLPPLPPPRLASPRGPRGPTTCELHPGEPLKLYCDTCATPICGLCTSGKAQRTHRGHSMVYLKVAVEGAKAANVKYLSDATGGAQVVRERLERSNKMAESVDAKAIQVAAEVRQASRRMIAAIEARERELLGQVERIRQLKNKSLIVQAEALRGLLQRYGRLSDSLRETLQLGDGVEQLHAKDKAGVELAQLRAARASLAGGGAGGKASPTMPYEDDVIIFAPPEPVLLRAMSTLGSVTSSGYALCTVAVGEGLSRAVRTRPAAFTVHVKNHMDMPAAATPPDQLEAVLVAPDGAVTRADVEDRRDGSFLVVYRARAEGPHGLHVTLRGRHIVGSPFHVVVRGVRSYDSVRGPTLSFGGEGGEDGRFLRPWGVCCDRAGRIIVADRSNNRVQVFRPDGTFLCKFGSQGTGPGQFDRPAGVASDPQGRIIVADKDNHRIQIFTGDGQFVLMFGEMGQKNGQFNYPWDVDVNAAGQIVVSDTRNHRIQLFSSDGQFLSKYGWEGSSSMWKHFDTPRGVCFNPDGYVIVTDFNNHRLVVVEPSFRNARFLGSEGSGLKQFQRPQGVAVDADGHIIVADSRNNRVQVFETNGTFLCQFGVDLDRPSGVCVTPEGLIAVVDFGHNRVVLF